MIEVEAPDGTVVEFPDGTAPDVIKGVMAKRFAPKAERSLGEEALRKGEFAARGISDSVLETIGAIPDLSAKATNAIGLTNIPDGFNTGMLKRGWNAFGRFVSKPLNAMFPGVMDGERSGADKFAYGAGHGAADAATIALPAAAVARGTQAGTVGNRVASALASQPVTQAVAGGAGQGVGEMTGNPYLGLATALAVPAATAAAGRMLTPVRSQLTREQQALADALMAEGVDLSAAQRTGSRPLHAIESVWQSLPFTARPAAEQATRQQRQFNRAVLARAGIDADNASPEVMDRAFRRLGGEFERLSAGTTVGLDDAFQQALGDAAARYGRKLPSQTREVFQAYLDDIGALGGEMPGTTYQVTRSDLTRQARSARNNDPFFAEALRGVRNALDDAAGRSMAPENADAWNEARQQYANLKTISKAATGGGQAGAGGDIAPAQIFSAAKQGQGADDFSRGRGDLNMLSRAGQLFLRNPVPNSGTAERTFWQSLMTGGAPGATVGAVTAGLPGAVAGVAAQLAGPRIAQALYNSRPVQGYLTNTLAQNLPPQDRLVAALLAAEQKRQLTEPRD